jgi:hypothetical protein
MLRQSETKIWKETHQATPSPPGFPALEIVLFEWSITIEVMSLVMGSNTLCREKEKCLKYCLVSNSMLKVSLYPGRVLHEVCVYENTPRSSELLSFQGYGYHLYRQFCPNLVTATLLGYGNTKLLGAPSFPFWHVSYWVAI